MVLAQELKVRLLFQDNVDFINENAWNLGICVKS